MGNSNSSTNTEICSHQCLAQNNSQNSPQGTKQKTRTTPTQNQYRKISNRNHTRSKLETKAQYQKKTPHTTQKINEMSFLKKINKKHLGRPRRKKTQINKNREKNFITDTTEIQKINKNYYEQLYTNKFDN